ncbi:YesU protein [Colletotrichum truncatum]|uniref:YesU protein n=1 Tax=Colletotrichum truncatum TaxID=5467 RepID=A0ACC3YRQ4_COLTU|nr:YesU protein [Colletotrichum truncatum]KAF6799261.1 YesU protein [Colletotrichum truncatum]
MRSVLLLVTLLASTMAEKLLYSNPLNSTADVATWVAEGPLNVKAVDGTLELSGGGDLADYFVYWVPEVFPDGIRITWEFSPRNEPGLAMFFFGAASAADDGKGSIFDPSLAPRNGSYPQYHSGDIRTLHASYFRRRWPEERAFHLANLRKSPGFHLVSQGADPLPPVADAAGAFYKIEVIKDKREVKFLINDLPIFEFNDDKSTGPVIRDGRIGFRQMQPLVARYRNLQVWKL